jgi:hypothetical protein
MRAGDLVRIRYRYVIACTSPACVPTDDTREIQLESARVGYSRRDGGDALGGTGRVLSQDIVTWPAFEVASRLGSFDVERARWRADIGALPEATVRSSPIALGAALLGSSALLALLGCGLLAALVRGRRPEAELAEEDVHRETPLERALAGVVAMSSNGAGPEQRRTLERLARELSATGRAELATRARRLAWSPQLAARSEVDSLAADVRAVVEEER